MKLEQLKAKIKSGAIDTVVVAFPDIFGRLSGKRFTGTFFLDAVAKHGTHACSYLITQNLDQDPWEDFPLANWDKGFADFHVVPDLGEIRLTPWLPGSVLILGDLHHSNHDPVVEAPREVLRRMVETAKKSGYTCFIASELEFFMFEGTYESAFQAGYRNLRPSSSHRLDYDLLQTSRDEEIFRKARNLFPLAGIPVENYKGEWGRGQHELNFTYGDPMTVADRHVVFKHGMKEIAQQHGKCVTFMAKPHAADAGSSCHIHLSLFKNGKNVFHDPKREDGTKLFRSFLGGLLKYSPDFTLLYAPTINSYKRFQALSWAPTKLVWAFDNRTVGFRVVGHGEGFRLENRMPGADANPYLAFAAMLAAGLAGVNEGLDCGKMYAGNAYADEKLPHLATTLAQAADQFSRSAVAKKYFGSEIVDFYARTARNEIREFNAAVTDWERGRYFEKI